MAITLSFNLYFRLCRVKAKFLTVKLNIYARTIFIALRLFVSKRARDGLPALTIKSKLRKGIRWPR